MCPKAPAYHDDSRVNNNSCTKTLATPQRANDLGVEGDTRATGIGWVWCAAACDISVVMGPSALFVAAPAVGSTLRSEGGRRRPEVELRRGDRESAASSTRHAALTEGTRYAAAPRWRCGGKSRRMRRGPLLSVCLLALGLGAADAIKCFEGDVTYCGINADGGAVAPPGSKRFVEGMNWACEDKLSNLDPTYIAPNCHGDCARCLFELTRILTWGQTRARPRAADGARLC